MTRTIQADIARGLGLSREDLDETLPIQRPAQLATQC